MANQFHRLAAGVVIVENDHILLVRDQHGWSLPKGSVEQDELMKETAEREAGEETGYIVSAYEVAFMIEFRSVKYGSYLQVYYHAKIRNGEMINEDPDCDIEEILFVHKSDLRNYIKFRPWILALEEWIREPITKYHSYDLDIDGYYI